MDAAFRTGGLSKARRNALLVNIICQGLAEVETSKRDKMYGSAAGKCARHSFLVQQVELSETVSASSKFYMSIGNAMHDTVCDGLFNSGNLIFKEYKIKVPDWLNLSGRIDALYEIDSQLALLEIKTCGDLPSEPSDDHTYQAQVYSLITGIETASLLYVSRNVGMPTPKMKEFKVDTSTEALGHVARQLVLADVGTRLGSQPDIPTNLTGPTSCKYCPFSNHCWNDNLMWDGPALKVADEVMEEVNQKVAKLLDGRQERFEQVLRFIEGNSSFAALAAIEKIVKARE